MKYQASWDMDRRLDDALNTVIAAMRGTKIARILADDVGGGIERLRSQRDGAVERQDIIVAYLVDRREQYDVSSGIYHAIGELIAGIQRGEHEAAHAHGEYDDILADRTVWPWRNT